MKKILLSPWTALVTLAIMLAIRIWDPSFVESIRLRYFDQLITSQAPVPVPVSVVNIDEATLDQLGQFPFPRGDYARIIKNLYQHGAGLVVFNVLMPEKDRFHQDQQLARTMLELPTVLPSIAGEKSKNANRPTSVQRVGQDPAGRVVEYPGMINNVPQVSEAASGVGMVNTFPEIDGVVRRMPLVIKVGEDLYPSLAMETLRTASGDTRIQVKIGDSGVEALRVPKLNKIATDGLSRIWIDWRASPQEYSYMDLPEDFHQGVVIVGLSAAGLSNPVATARGGVWPQYLQAAVLGTMLNNSVIQRPDWADTLEVAILAVLGIILLFLTRWVYVGLATTVVIIGGSICASIYWYHVSLQLVDVTLLSVGLGLVALHAYGIKFVSEFLQKQQIRKQFQSYLSPDLVAKLVKDPSLLKLGGTEQDLTIQFSDVRGFTSISEHYGRDVQGLTKIMNRYMTVITKVILENDGTLDKYIGDATMAFWNAPLDNRQHAKDSVRAALAMIDAVAEFNREIAEEGVPPFGLGIGCNTGIVVVGNMGGEQRFDYTCLGDAVNLSSRLEGQSKNYGVLIVLGQETAHRLDYEFFTMELDCIAVKGKKEGITIYTVFRNPETGLEQWKESRERHKAMLAEYRGQNWDHAKMMVSELRGQFGGNMDHYYDLWSQRIEEMRDKNLPADWDGVYVATSK